MPPPRRGRAEAAEALAAAAPLATRWMERLLARQDPPLTVTQYLALRAIAREGVSTTELARRAGVSEPAASQLLSGLVEAELVERRGVEEDRRSVALVLSQAGRRTLVAADKLLARRLGSMLAELPQPEVDALSRLLPRLEAALSGKPPPRRPPPPRPRHPPRPPDRGRRR